MFVRPRVFGGARALDAALAAGLAIAALQLVPVPGGARAAMSPARADVERALLLDPGGAGPLTLDPTATAWALVTGVALLLLFLSARAVFERHEGLRQVCRGVAWIGLALGAAAFVQRALTPAHIYGAWRPPGLAANVLPWGPFVNRNDFAGWLMMAVPLVLGYTLMRLDSRRRAGNPHMPVERLIDARLVLLLASACVMTGALIASLSRSGIFGLAVALAAFLVLARTRLGRRGATLLAAAVGVLVVLVATSGNLAALVARMNDVSGLGGRVAVWRESWAIVRDFAAAGVGVGAFERAMLVYQESNRLLFFNHAHNEILQLAAEGGIALALAGAAAAAAAFTIAVRRLRADRSPVFWVRAGALCGMLAAACQSMWDTPLRMPANGVLLALLVAIATHAPAAARR